MAATARASPLRVRVGGRSEKRQKMSALWRRGCFETDGFGILQMVPNEIKFKQSHDNNSGSGCTLLFGKI